MSTIQPSSKKLNTTSKKHKKENNTVLLFTYGSLNAEMIKHLTGKSVLTKPKYAYMRNYLRIFAGESEYWEGAVASIYPYRCGKVVGAVVEVSKEHLVDLDEYEGTGGIPGGYSRVRRRVYFEDGSWASAYVYIRDDPFYDKPPSKRYINSIKRTLKAVNAIHKDPIYINKVIPFKENNTKFSGLKDSRHKYAIVINAKQI